MSRQMTIGDAVANYRQTAPVRQARGWRMPYFTIFLSFFLVEGAAFFFLTTLENQSAFVSMGYAVQDLSQLDFWPLAFGALWAVLLGCLVWLLPGIWGRVIYGILYFLSVFYAAVQTGYFILFREMLWLSDFRYASEGAGYANVLLTYPLNWYICLGALILAGILILVKFPRPARRRGWVKYAAAILGGVAAVLGMILLPDAVFAHDRMIQFAVSDYGRSQSAEAAYNNMFNAHRLYQVCGLYQTGVKDIWANYLSPLLPDGNRAADARAEIDNYFAARGDAPENEMTGLFEGKNVVLVLMESMDDWAIGEHTPTICRLMKEGINFTNFYTPPYGGVRTFNSEFCVNTGSFLSSQGGYAFDYVTNDFRQSLASQLGALGYSSLAFHYNDPSFYSRGVFEPAMGYEAYVSYQEYVTEETEDDLYDDQFLFNYPQVSETFFREGPKLNFIITRSAHLNYIYNEVLSYWGLKKYPEYRGMTGNQEEDCMYLKARLVDDLFARLLQELEDHGELENTVIVAFTDHYTYGIEDQSLVWDRSGVDDALLVEKTPCFIWSADGPAMEVTKTLNTADLLPTVLNLLGVETELPYLGRDAFDPGYTGYALFPNGSWVAEGIAYNASNGRVMYLDPSAQEITPELQQRMSELVTEFVRVNNLILEYDYYKE